jgi:magnesium-protoporphyrin O-methyltransferase
MARHMAERYRQRGLDRTSARIVGFLETQGLEGATILEIGGGVGEIQIELLRRGAARAVNLELSSAYDHDAEALLREAGLEGRVDRQVRDIAADGATIDPADLVVLNRVVCCYPDYERLLDAAATHARRLVVFSHPPRNAASRLVIGIENLVLRLTRKEFRIFAHPPAGMLRVLEERGFQAIFARHGLVWHIDGLGRRQPAGEPVPAA